MAIQIQITGRNVDLTPALKDDINKKFSKLEKHFKKIINIHITLSVEKVNRKIQHTAKAHINLPPRDIINAESTSENMYASIDMVLDKLDRQLIEHKEKLEDE